jgi:hypothetical protein
MLIKKSKVSIVLMSFILVLTLVLDNAIKANACSKWNPFCSSKPEILVVPGKGKTNNIPSTPIPTQNSEVPHTISPEDGGKTWILHRPDNSKLVYFSSSFTQEEINYMFDVVGRASGKVSNTYKDEFRSCVDKFVNRNSTDNSFLNKMPISMIYFRLTSASRIYFQKTINAPKKTMARAKLGSNPNNNKFYLMNINPIYLHPYSDLSKLDIEQRSLFMRDADVMAGTVIHEMLHNLGYGHNQYSQTENENDRNVEM